MLFPLILPHTAAYFPQFDRVFNWSVDINQQVFLLRISWYLFELLAHNNKTHARKKIHYTCLIHCTERINKYANLIHTWFVEICNRPHSYFRFISLRESKAWKIFSIDKPYQVIICAKEILLNFLMQHVS